MRALDPHTGGNCRHVTWMAAMKKPRSSPPDAVPVLARGKHRHPRKGGCFMEFASFMAGERWTDHPECTHPTVASLARDVNDQLSDQGRSRIVGLIPDVIGLVGDDALIDLTVAVRAATAAFPVAAFERQKSLAVALLRCERELARHPRGNAPELHVKIRSALAEVPEAARWARRFPEQPWGKVKDFSYTAQHTVHLAVSGIAGSCVRDVDDRLIELLSTCVHELREQMCHDSVEVEQPGTPHIASQLAARSS